MKKATRLKRVSINVPCGSMDENIMHYIGFVKSFKPTKKPKSEKIRKALNRNAKNRIRLCKFLWEEEKNPLFVWETYLLCEENNIRMPDWVREYFMEISLSLIATECTKRQRAPVTAYKILQMNGKGRGNVFSRYHELNMRIMAAHKVLKKKKNAPEMLYKEIYPDVSGGNLRVPIKVSDSAISKWNKKHKSHAEMILKHPSFPRTFPK